MTELEKRAQKLIDEKKRTADEVARQLEEAKTAKLLQLNNEFKKGFNDVLDLLIEAGVAWKAGVQDSGDGYIEFTRGDKSLKMDFSHATSYRYCFIDRTDKCYNRDFGYGNMVYGEWTKDDFIVWIYKNLMVEEPEGVPA